MSPPAIAVAALSARMMVESLAKTGRPVVALDVFGDADTRRAAAHCETIGRDDALALAPGRFTRALARCARAAPLAGWIAGPGFEGHEVLLRMHGSVPLLGNAADTVRRVREPRGLADWLARRGFAHPEVRAQAPRDVADGWLEKCAASSGGLAVRPAVPATTGARGRGARDPIHSPYWQRRAHGVPVSALFVADGARARLVACSRQLVAAHGERPFRFAGALGPLPLDGALRRRYASLVDALAGDFGLVGLCSVDTLLDGRRVTVLEVNPRPSASMALYDDTVAGGLMQAHLAATQDGRLPRVRRALPGAPWRGVQIVTAPRPVALDARAVARLQRLVGGHDLPAQPQALLRGMPVCTVDADGPTAFDVLKRLAQRQRSVLRILDGAS